MAPTLELTEGALRRHLTLEMLDGTLDTTITDLDLERPTLNCFAGISHGGRDMADDGQKRKPGAPFFAVNRKSAPRPAGIRAPHGAQIFEISWENGTTHRIPHRVLRGYCPCAACQGHSGQIAFQAGGNLDLRDITPVGNYALALTWGDHHDSGIFSFDYLFHLGQLVDDMGEQPLVDLDVLPKGRAASSESSRD